MKSQLGHWTCRLFSCCRFCTAVKRAPEGSLAGTYVTQRGLLLAVANSVFHAEKFVCHMRRQRKWLVFHYVSRKNGGENQAKEKEKLKEKSSLSFFVLISQIICHMQVSPLKNPKEQMFISFSKHLYSLLIWIHKHWTKFIYYMHKISYFKALWEGVVLANAITSAFQNIQKCKDKQNNKKGCCVFVNWVSGEGKKSLNG